eukprot:CAMPEP_0172301852 /NCGR_PEP_ID=MMETSP1058-20130122/3671_1 /TAXON_ID=83371 /ORGANISM="Detonula confervacea, Strain CCMP 353" /LENGTH=597 /DNA_ID=CAMNT_0013012139 /DNA_START=29 /DNA_END=1819 /DNA_ORIENTATION=+
MATESSSAGACLKMRSIYVSSLTDAESQSGGAHRTSGLPPDQTDGVDHFNENKVTASEEEALDPIQLPQSTHSLLFSEPVFSLPYGFALGLFTMSTTCLVLALVNNINTNDIPANVMPAVRTAQYLSILIALLMEEEIPTGLYLLRMIPRQSLRQKFPQMRYRKFIFSSMMRIFLGYFFLINVLLVLIQATGVIEIFYDVLALEFVQQLDDIAFKLAKMDVFGKTMQRACTAKCFRAEFEKKRLGTSRKLSIFLKAIYFFHLCAMFAGMLYVTVHQMRGDYHHDLITVDFANTIWEGAWVKVPSRLPSSQQYEERTLVYSHFNGVYQKNGTHDGRPVYQETRKFDRRPYEEIVPAEIKYCEDISAWVFVHEDIRKLKSSKKTGCHNWLLRSSETTEFDLLNVVGNWKVWIGVIGKAEVTIATNVCKDEMDCNLNGQCRDGKCSCNHEDGARYLGTHCEVRLRDACGTITGEVHNDTWTVTYLRSWSEDFWSGDELYEEYSRPVYSYVAGHPDWDINAANETSPPFLMYSGDRWFGAHVPKGNTTDEEAIWSAVEYHAFWSEIYKTSTFLVSDPTTGSTPVGVDFFLTRERGEQYGPW